MVVSVAAVDEYIPRQSGEYMAPHGLKGRLAAG